MAQIDVPNSQIKMRDEMVDMEEAFTCPISGKLIEEPVSTIYEHLYERERIELWVRMNATCPLTAAPLALKDIMPQPAVKEAIQRYKKLA